MKTTILFPIVLGLLSTLSFAELKPVGTVVPYACAKQVVSKVKGHKLHSVCMSQAQGFRDELVVLQFVRGSGVVREDVYKVIRNLPKRNGTQTELAYLGYIVNGKIKYKMTEEILPPVFTLQNGENMNGFVVQGGKAVPFFTAKNFETIFTTMSVGF